jgi:hypothetical protein
MIYGYVLHPPDRPQKDYLHRDIWNWKALTDDSLFYFISGDREEENKKLGHLLISL